MKRLINIRPSMFAAGGLSLGILGGYFLLYGRYAEFTAVLAFSLLFFIMGCIIYRKIKLAHSLVLLFLVLGFLLFRIAYVKISNYEIEDTAGTLRGRVTDLHYYGDGNLCYVEECTFVDGDGEAYELSGKTKLFVPSGFSYGVGDEIIVTGTLRTSYVFKDNVQTFSVRNEIRYELDDVKNFVVRSGSLKLDETCRKYVFETFSESMPESGGTAFALLTGDKSAMADDDVTAFRRAGVMHLLAVSGLHVGLVVTVFGFVLERFRIHPLIKLVILLAPLFLYAYVCGFPPSVLRAIVMTCCIYIVRTVFGKVDLLTSLSWAALAILIYQPLYLFDAGFLLSFSSVFGIATLYGTLNRKIRRLNANKIVKYILSSLALSVSTAISTFCPVAYFYGEVPLLGIVFNLVAIPVVSVIFVLNFVGLISFVSKYVLWVCNKAIYYFTVAAKFISSLPFATVTVDGLVLVAVVVAVWLFILGGYVNVKGKAALVLHGVMAVLLALCLVVELLPSNTETQVTVFQSYNDTVAVATDSGGNAAIVCNWQSDADAVNVEQLVAKRRISSCTLFITDFSVSDGECMRNFVEKYKPNVYVLSLDKNEAVENLLTELGVNMERSVKNDVLGSGITCRSVYDGTLSGLVLNVDGMRVAVALCGGARLARFTEVCGAVSFYITDSVTDDFLQCTEETLVVSKYQAREKFNYGANKYGNFTITEKDGKMILTV